VHIQKTFSTFALFAAAGLVTDSALAVDVLFVDNEAPDSSWQMLIEDGGANTYTEFDSGTYSFSLNNQESLDYVNGFDVIVVSGSNAAFNAVRNHGQTWHAQPTPILNIGPYLASGQFTNNSWGFFQSGGKAAGNPSDAPDVNDASSPAWNGITLLSGDTVAPDLYASNDRVAQQNGKALKPGVTSVATASGASQDQVIMHAAPGAIAPGGEEAYFMTGMSGNSAEAVPFTADGETVFLNLIDALTGGGTPSLPGDTDGDGDVDDADLGTAFANYTGPLAAGVGTKTAEQGDTDGDGDVDDADLGTAFAAYTGPLASAAVPEPTSLALLGLGGLAMIRRRRA